MKSYSFTPQGVCAKRITFAIGDDGKLHDVHFVGGCPGNPVSYTPLRAHETDQ